MPPKKSTKVAKAPVAKTAKEGSLEQPKPAAKPKRATNKTEEDDDDDEYSDRYDSDSDSETPRDVVINVEDADIDNDYNDIGYADDQEGEDLANDPIEIIDEVTPVSSTFTRKERVIIKKNRISIPMMTEYEKTKIIANRATSIQNGAAPMVTTRPDMSEEQIAMLEMQKKKCPMIIYRPIPSLSMTHEYYEEWKVKELEILWRKDEIIED